MSQGMSIVRKQKLIELATKIKDGNFLEKESLSLEEMYDFLDFLSKNFTSLSDTERSIDSIVRAQKAISVALNYILQAIKSKQEVVK